MRREDGGDKIDLFFYLLVLDFEFEVGDVGVFFEDEIDDGRLINLLYLFLKY